MGDDFSGRRGLFLGFSLLKPILDENEKPNITKHTDLVKLPKGNSRKKKMGQQEVNLFIHASFSLR